MFKGRVIGGVLTDGKSVKAPVLMWVNALDLLLSKFTPKELQLVDVVSGCGQQHGSVYWAKGALNTLKGLDPERDLKDQLVKAFSVLECPIWMDSSTTDQIRILENVVGGPQKLAEITGSAGFERFTGSQILKIIMETRLNYDNTERISLVSSFIASLLIQEYSSIDVSDGSGMNLLDIHSKKWSNRILQAIDPDLEDKLGSQLVLGSDIVGNIGNYFVKKYSFSPKCIVSAFTGDNPASLSCMIWEQGDLMVSLGTSDTLFLALKDPVPNNFSHVLCHPNHLDLFMGMIVYKNGSLTRKAIRDEFCHSSWDVFNQFIIDTEPGCNGYLGYYLKVPEISPRIIESGFYYFKGLMSVSKVDDNLHPRLIIESQFMAMKRHATKIGVSPRQIYATGNIIRIIIGGASQNITILQICSDVFGVKVYADDHPNSAALGCAFRGIAALQNININHVIPRKNLKAIVTPRSEYFEMYKGLMTIQEEIESILLASKNFQT